MDKHQTIDEIAFLDYLVQELNTVNFGEGSQVNLPVISRSILKRIEKLKKLTK